MPFDRDVFFEQVRPIFGGKLTQQQVDGMNALLGVWELNYEGEDTRWLANPLAQAKWETSSTMWPIAEYGKGSGMAYGKPDPETGQTYYGRGYVQITWRDNYAKADRELGLNEDDSCEWHADNALDEDIASSILFVGMMEGWFRSSGGTPNNLAKYFNATTNDAYNAREIVNGDKAYTKDWLPKGETVGSYIKRDHESFLKALNAAYVEPLPIPELEIEPDVPVGELVVTVTIEAPPGVRVEVKIAAPES